jgi:hypothetical protein
MGWPKGKPRKPRLGTDTATRVPHESSSNTADVWKEIKHFTPREFTCKCHGFCDHPSAISIELVEKLDTIRHRIAMPVTIVSGTRCERQNRLMGGDPHSAHLAKSGVSHAVDIRCPDSAFRFAFLNQAFPLFNRIGIGKYVIHVDDDPELPPNVVWVY